MQGIAQLAVEEALRAGADYADARIQRLACEELTMQDGSLVRADAPEDFGLGVRVLKDGAWGFAAAPGTHKDLAEVAPGLARRAVKTGRDLGRLRTKPVQLAPLEGQVGEWSTPVEEDPFAVSLEEKLGLMKQADESMQGRDEIVSRVVNLSLRREEQWQASSEGSQLHQVLVRSGGGLAATASAHGVVERRSYPASFSGNFMAGGFEVVRAMDLPANGGRMRDEAADLCSAPLCSEGPHTLILGGSQLCLQIHESVGHPTELDRVLGHEVDLAGASFATRNHLGNLEYGSSLVNLQADSTLPGGLDTRGWDDDCVPSGSWPIVKEGVFKGYQTNREVAGAVDESTSRGCSRAESWYDPPIVRITNLSLQPGKMSFDEMVANTEDGAIFADSVRTWSIDQRRVNFQFTCEVAREVQGGRLGRLLRRPTYQGNTTSFWGSCDAICSAEHFHLWGVANCGKGNPMQVAEMTHGAAPARFRGVQFIQ